MKSVFLLTGFLLFGSFSFSQKLSTAAQLANAAYWEEQKKLDSVCNQILEEYKSDNQFIENFKKAEKYWVKFRDAQVAMKFLNANTKDINNAQSECIYRDKLELTKDRIKELQLWADGIKENEKCSGSIKVNQ